METSASLIFGRISKTIFACDDGVGPAPDSQRPPSAATSGQLLTLHMMHLPLHSFRLVGSGPMLASLV